MSPSRSLRSESSPEASFDGEASGVFGVGASGRGEGSGPMIGMAGSDSDSDSTSRFGSSPFRPSGSGSASVSVSGGRSAFAEEATDARLVEAARGGDDDAFAKLVARYERKLLRVLDRLVHNRELARDLAQETFWKVYRNLDRYDVSRRFGPWLFRIAVNLGVDWLRRNPGVAGSFSLDQPRGRDGEEGAAPGLELADPDPRAREELAQEVRHVLRQVPPNYRAILVLRDLEGFSSAEVAAIVNRREATVRWRLSKAREMFREIWEARHGAQLRFGGAGDGEGIGGAGVRGD